MDEINEEKNKKDNRNEKTGCTIWGIILLLIAGFFIFKQYQKYDTNTSKVLEAKWGQVENAIRAGDVAKIVVLDKKTADIYLKEERFKKPEYKGITEDTALPQYTMSIGSIDAFVNQLYKAQEDLPLSQQVLVTYIEKSNWFSGILLWILPFFFLFFVWSYFSKGGNRGGGGGGFFGFAQSHPALFEKTKNVHVTFKDVAGLDEARQEVEEVVDFLKNPTTYTSLGAKIPKGVLLIGAPGTGKTLLAKAVAGEAAVPFFSLSGSEFVEMFVGVGASRVRDLFKKAKEKAPCIVFIDEIDAIGRSRGKGQNLNGVNDERESTLNQLLTEMDGFSTNSGVIVLAATNRGDILDPALLRPGRFDRHINLELPDVRERKEIFGVHIRPIKTDSSIDITLLADETPGFSGADITNVCNEAALIAARRKKNTVSREDFTEALDRIIGGLEKRQKIITPKEKETIAYHEAGHACATYLLKGLKDIVKVSIIPRGKSLGAAWYRPEELQLYSMRHLLNDIRILLAGRAAEDVLLGEISSGALDDLEKATKQAYAIVVYYGLGDKMRNISYYDSTGNNENAFQKPYSEETARMIDEEVRVLIDKAYTDIKTLLGENKEDLTKAGKLLLEKEVIYKDDLRKLWNVTESLE